ncbi:MAG: adenylyltransferase/cytidyltransferase family protein [Lachnospiraceae bacterium]|nr:adenylyltransferase/cytidyltransferase family protein [Lachnospiraceae bacterium]
MDIKEADLVFLSKKDMTSVYELEDILDLPDVAYYHFMHYEDEVLYIHKAGKMLGVCSIGDLERFYERNEQELKINQQYIFLKKIDYHMALEFFKRRETINEIPVVTDGNELTGVIRYEKEGKFRSKQRRTLKYVRTSAWHMQEIERFVCKTKARVLLYSYSNKEVMEHLSEEEIQILRKRREKADGGICSDPLGLSNEEWRNFYQLNYETGIVETMISEMDLCRPVVRNGITTFLDMDGKYYHFRDGYRITSNNPVGADRRIIMFGPCIIVGGYNKDESTIAYYLQNCLNEDHYTEWKVLNKGMYNPDLCYGRMFEEELSENDIVIIWCIKKPEIDKMSRNVFFQGDLTEVFLEMPFLTDNLINHPLHCNHIVNQKIAERIYRDFCKERVLEVSRNFSVPEKIQDYYISWDVHEYFMEYFAQYGLCKETNRPMIGAIVMNCNPFTKGHRYLIEQALSRVDKLYLFVVEEDKSYFSFQDRFRMVEQGVLDLVGVHVVPSGKYILSKDTFAQYFEKETVQVIEEMDYDIRIFGEVVARNLGIQYRFVGEEPFDEVTKSYNETMKRILPEYGIAVVEIPRVTCDEKGGAIISATLVRKALEEKNWNIVETLCPESTVAYLKKQYTSG